MTPSACQRAARSGEGHDQPRIAALPVASPNSAIGHKTDISRHRPGEQRRSMSWSTRSRRNNPFSAGAIQRAACTVTRALTTAQMSGRSEGLPGPAAPSHKVLTVAHPIVSRTFDTSIVRPRCAHWPRFRPTFARRRPRRTTSSPKSQGYRMSNTVTWRARSPAGALGDRRGRRYHARARLLYGAEVMS